MIIVDVLLSAFEFFICCLFFSGQRVTLGQTFVFFARKPQCVKSGKFLTCWKVITQVDSMKSGHLFQPVKLKHYPSSNFSFCSNSSPSLPPLKKRSIVFKDVWCHRDILKNKSFKWSLGLLKALLLSKFTFSDYFVQSKMVHGCISKLFSPNEGFLKVMERVFIASACLKSGRERLCEWEIIAV